MQFYINRNQQQLGPFDEAEVRAQLTNSTVSTQDLVWWEGQTGWVPLGQSFLAMKATPAVPPVVSPVVPPAVPLTGAITPANDRTSGLAIAALVSGIASFFVGFTFIAAIILGHLGLSEIRKNPGMKGRGMAIWGLVLGYLIPVLAVISIVAISVLLALGNNVKSTFDTINAQLQAAQTNTASATTNSAPANGQ